MFDVNRDEKIYWTDFMRGLKQCMFANESELDGFIFHFFSLNEFMINLFLLFSRIDVEFEEFQTIMQHLPPSVLYVVIKSSENRSRESQS